AIEAFSWDGSLAVQVADNNGPVSVIRWRDGTAIWSGPSDAGYWDAMPEPGGQRIAVLLRDPEHPQTGGYPPHNVYVVGPDGTASWVCSRVRWLVMRSTRSRIPFRSVSEWTARAADRTLILPGGRTRRSASLMAGPARA